MQDFSIVLTTTGSSDEARKIASVLVERKLAACVNILPQIQSIYRWQGTVESSTEWLLVIKTTEAAYPNVQEMITELHSYELPECLLIGIEDGSEKYLKWISDSVEIP